MERASIFQNNGLAMAAHIRQQLNAIFGSNKHTSFTLLRKREVIALLGHSKLVTHITWARLKDGLQFALK
jgi:hypothetical protein